jgi:transposase-like protein
MRPVREWEAKLTPALTEDLRRRRRKAGRSWYVDETYIKVDGAGAISTAPSTVRALWWTCCSMGTGT